MINEVSFGRRQPTETTAHLSSDNVVGARAEAEHLEHLFRPSVTLSTSLAAQPKLGGVAKSLAHGQCGQVVIVLLLYEGYESCGRRAQGLIVQKNGSRSREVRDEPAGKSAGKDL